MRKLTLEERVTRLERAIAGSVKNEATREAIMAIPGIVRDYFAKNDVLQDYIDAASKIRINSISMPARARKNDKYDEVHFDLKMTQPCTDENTQDDIGEVAGDAMKECLKKNGYHVDEDATFATCGNTALMCTAKLKTNVKPMYYKPGKDTDAEWETGLEPDQKRQRAADKNLRDTNYYGLGK